MRKVFFGALLISFWAVPALAIGLNERCSDGECECVNPAEEGVSVTCQFGFYCHLHEEKLVCTENVVPFYNCNQDTGCFCVDQEPIYGEGLGVHCAKEHTCIRTRNSYGCLPKTDVKGLEHNTKVTKPEGDYCGTKFKDGTGREVLEFCQLDQICKTKSGSSYLCVDKEVQVFNPCDADQCSCENGNNDPKAARDICSKGQYCMLKAFGSVECIRGKPLTVGEYHPELDLPCIKAFTKDGLNGLEYCNKNEWCFTAPSNGNQRCIKKVIADTEICTEYNNKVKDEDRACVCVDNEAKTEIKPSIFVKHGNYCAKMDGALKEWAFVTLNGWRCNQDAGCPCVPIPDQPHKRVMIKKSEKCWVENGEAVGITYSTSTTGECKTDICECGKVKCTKGQQCYDNGGVSQCLAPKTLAHSQQCNEEIGCACVGTPDFFGAPRYAIIVKGRYCAITNGYPESAETIIEVGGYSDNAKGLLCKGKDNGADVFIYCSGYGSTYCVNSASGGPTCVSNIVSANSFCSWTNGCVCTMAGVKDRSKQSVCQPNEMCVHVDTQGIGKCIAADIREGQLCESGGGCFCWPFSYSYWGNQVIQRCNDQEYCTSFNDKIACIKAEKATNFNKKVVSREGEICVVQNENFATFRKYCMYNQACRYAADELFCEDPDEPIKIIKDDQCGSANGACNCYVNEGGKESVPCYANQICSEEGGKPVCKFTESVPGFICLPFHKCKCGTSKRNPAIIQFCESKLNGSKVEYKLSDKPTGKLIYPHLIDDAKEKQIKAGRFEIDKKRRSLLDEGTVDRTIKFLV